MRAPTKLNYLEPTQRAGKIFTQRGLEGGIVMLNLLRFREIADYSANPELAPLRRSAAQKRSTDISGTRSHFCAIAEANSCCLALAGLS